MSPGVPFNGAKKTLYIEWSTKWMMLVVRQIQTQWTSEQIYLWCIRNGSKNRERERAERIRKNGEKNCSVEPTCGQPQTVTCKTSANNT